VPRVVLDTNVLVAASRSRWGASAKLLSLLGTGRFDVCISVPLTLEYESAMTRDVEPYSSDWRVRMDILDYLCSVAKPQEIFFLWRPYLRDPNDEMVLEVAIAGGCSGIVSYNARDFTGIERFNLTIHTPKEFLEVIGALP
jgi:putative PIN family toxin of toxin-antitoxin system